MISGTDYFRNSNVDMCFLNPAWTPGRPPDTNRPEIVAADPQKSANGLRTSFSFAVEVGDRLGTLWVS